MMLGGDDALRIDRLSFFGDLPKENLYDIGMSIRFANKLLLISSAQKSLNIEPCGVLID